MTKPKETVKVELLICKCRSCTHWEVGRDFLLCKTCGETLPVTLTVDLHDGVHWEEHAR